MSLKEQKAQHVRDELTSQYMIKPSTLWNGSTKTNPLKRTWSEDIPEEILTKIKKQNVKAHQIVDRYKHCYWLSPDQLYIGHVSGELQENEYAHNWSDHL